MHMTWTPDIFWQLFELTGSVWAYMAYRRCAALTKFLANVSPN